VTHQESQWELAAKDSRRRGKKRLKLILFSLPVVVFALFVAFKLMGLSITTQSAIQAYNVGDYEKSIERSESLLDLNIVEPWIPYFNRADAHAANEYYVDSVDDFEKALELAPQEKQCDIRINLALSWELLGDIYKDGGYFQGAVLLYETAEQVIADGGPECEPPQQEQLDDASDRIETKKDEAQAQQDARDAQEEGDDSLNEKLDELGEQGDAGAEEKANEESRERGEDDGDGSLTDKPW